MHETKDSSVPCAGFITAPNTSILPALQSSTICFDVGSMSKANLFDFINDFLHNEIGSNSEHILLRISSQPAVFVRPFSIQLLDALTDSWTRSHSLYLAYGSNFSSVFPNFSSFRATTTYSDLIQNIQDDTVSGTNHNVYLATRDLFLLISASNVYFDPLKLSHLINSEAHCFTGTLVLLITYDTLILLARSSMGTALLVYSTTLIIHQEAI